MVLSQNKNEYKKDTIKTKRRHRYADVRHHAVDMLAFAGRRSNVFETEKLISIGYLFSYCKLLLNTTSEQKLMWGLDDCYRSNGPSLCRG